MSGFDERRWHALPLVAFVLFAAAAAWIAVGARYGGFFSDSVDYLVVADFFRSTFGATDVSPFAASLFHGTRFPPL